MTFGAPEISASLIRTDVENVRTLWYTLNMKVSPTELRQNLYRIIDSALETGEVVEIVRKGRTVRLVPDRKADIWERLERHDAVVGDPAELVHTDWSTEWNPDGN